MSREPASRLRGDGARQADALLVIGASFANHTGIADYKPTIQVDYDPMALGRFHPVTRVDCRLQLLATAKPLNKVAWPTGR